MLYRGVIAPATNGKHGRDALVALVWDAQGGAGEALEEVCGGAGPTGHTGGTLWNAQGRRRAAPGEMRGGASRAPTLMYKTLSCHSLVWDTYYMLMKFDYRPALEFMMSNLESL